MFEQKAIGNEARILLDNMRETRKKLTGTKNTLAGKEQVHVED